MSLLHMSKVAVGCASLQALNRRQAARRQDDVVPITTRFKPKRAEELVGGSLYWIVKHRIAARQRIIGFAESEGDRRTIIRLDAELVPVLARPMRAHQGWRYLVPDDVPPDMASAGDGLDRLPAALAGRLAVLALI